MPSIPTIQVRIPLKSSVFSVKVVFEKNENKQKEAGVGPFFKKYYNFAQNFAKKTTKWRTIYSICFNLADNIKVVSLIYLLVRRERDK